MTWKALVLAAAAVGVASAGWGSGLGEYNGGLTYGDLSSSSTVGDLTLLGDWDGYDSTYDDHHSVTSIPLGDAPAKKTLRALAELETILIKLVYKALKLVEEIYYYVEKLAGGGEHWEMRAYTFEEGSYSAKDKLYWLEKKLAIVLKEIARVVRMKLTVAFGHHSYHGYDFAAGDELAGFEYHEGDYHHKKDYTVGDSIFAPIYESGTELNLYYVKHKLGAIKKLLWFLKGTAFKTLKQIKAIKEIIHAIKVASHPIVVSSPEQDYSSSSLGTDVNYDDYTAGVDSSSSSLAGYGAGDLATVVYDSSSSNGLEVGSGDDNSSSSTGNGTVLLNRGRVVKLLRLLAHAEKALKKNIKLEAKIAKKLVYLAFALKEAGAPAFHGKY